MVCTQITVPLQTKCHTLKYARHRLHPAITNCTNTGTETMPLINKFLTCKETNKSLYVNSNGKANQESNTSAIIYYLGFKISSLLYNIETTIETIFGAI